MFFRKPTTIKLIGGYSITVKRHNVLIVNNPIGQAIGQADSFNTAQAMIAAHFAPITPATHDATWKRC